MSDTLTTTTTDQGTPFRAAETHMTFLMARGHAHRNHHELTGHWVEQGGIRTLVRTCCEVSA